jgi:uncharacterized protein YndB with AHSA1/START domain
MAATTSAAARSAERELVITRVIDAPRTLVFKAWTEPEHLVRWWGPKGFTTPYCQMDVRPGGRFHHCMRSPEGREFWGRGVYREIVPPERIVFATSFADAAGNAVGPERYGMNPDWPFETLITVTFAEHHGKTKLTVRQSVSVALAQSIGAVQGWNETLDRLVAELAQA